jgi:hypothetical protein
MCLRGKLVVLKQGAEWVFDALPPSGARRGGDPANHVFDATLRTFVREVVQNASDQPIADGVPEVHFRFHRLSGDELTAFWHAVGGPSIRPHLDAAAKTPGGRAIKQALEDLDQRKTLLLLEIEDRDTVGLTGHELEGESHFRALCKDTLYSHKQSTSAGGSYGLGKSVLWGFSGLATVLFNSKLSIELPGQESPRLIGRAELPTHEVAGREAPSRGSRWYAGSGWFGRRVGDVATHAESIWSEQAAQLAATLHLGRTNRDSAGTSILVLGFRDPAAERERSTDELAQDIRHAIEREFWPATVMPGRRLVTWVASNGQGRTITRKDFHATAPFVQCYEGRASVLKMLSDPGDVVTQDISIEVPARRDGSTRATKGIVSLCVRLAREQEPRELLGRLAMFRGPGMVIRYKDHSSLATSARPFHAIAACGTARNPGAPTPADDAVERFLRAAEPPGHDRWESTATLKAEYERGYAKALEQFDKQVSAALKAIVVAQPKHGQRGPERLRRRFPIGVTGGGGARPRVHNGRFTRVGVRSGVEGVWGHWGGPVRAC